MDLTAFFTKILPLYIWPLASLTILVVYKKQILSVLKFENQSNIQVENKKTSVSRKEEKDLNVEDVNYTLNLLEKLHPNSLGILVEIGNGTISSSAWSKYEKYLKQLEERDFIFLEINNEEQANLGELYRAEARLTKKGRDFLRKIGFYD